MGSMPNILQNMVKGNSGAMGTGQSKIGMAPFGNAGGSNNPGPTQMNNIARPIGGPVGAVPPTSSVGGLNPTAGPTPTSGVNPLNRGDIHANNTQTLGGGNPTGAVPNAGAVTVNTGGGNQVTVDTTSGPFAGMNQGQIQEYLKQLENIYGHGSGAVLFSILGNLGSSNDQYMAAYEKAMAGPNAENLATLNTTLGNSGVGANSSAAAIANADFESNITAQEGLQEQQLQEQDKQDMLGLLTKTLPAAQKEVSDANSSVFSDILGIGSQVAGLAGDVMGIPGVSGAISGVFSGGASPSNANQGGAQSSSSDSYLAGLL